MIDLIKTMVVVVCYGIMRYSSLPHFSLACELQTALFLFGTTESAIFTFHCTTENILSHRLSRMQPFVFSVPDYLQLIVLLQSFANRQKPFLHRRQQPEEV